MDYASDNLSYIDSVALEEWEKYLGSLCRLCPIFQTVKESERLVALRDEGLPMGVYVYPQVGSELVEERLTNLVL
jgi:hypothetical protein